MLPIFVLAFSLSTDAFAIALRSIASPRSMWWYVLITALIFGVIEMLLAYLGWQLGNSISQDVITIHQWIAIALLILVGGKKIRDGFSYSKPLISQSSPSLLILMGMAIGSSLDAFVVGLLLAFFYIDIFPTAFVIGFVTFGMVIIGMTTKSLMGARTAAIQSVVQSLGGTVLIGIALFIFWAHLKLL